MLKILNTFFSLVIIAGILSLTACEGPEGPEGPAGPKGADGADATGQCLDCHNSSSELYAKVYQYESSMHFTGMAAGYAGPRAYCSQCHSNEGFNLLVAGEEMVDQPDATPVNCRTCHNIHETYSSDDYGLKTVAPVTLMGELTGGATFDHGSGNLCANCHQMFDYSAIDPNATEIFVSSTHWGGHHGPQSNIYIGKGFFEIPGDVAYGNSPHTTMVDNSCVTCHTTSHTFAADESACATCHGADPDFSSFDADFAASLEALKTVLVDNELLAGNDTDGYHPNPGTYPKNQAGALFNYMAVSEDGSHGYHNPKYVLALLKNSVKAFD